MPDLWSVSELNRDIKQSLEMDYRLQDLRVTGEVSGFSAYRTCHWYFTLNADAAPIRCVTTRGRRAAERATDPGAVGTGAGCLTPGVQGGGARTFMVAQPRCLAGRHGRQRGACGEGRGQRGRFPHPHLLRGPGRPRRLRRSRAG